MHYIHDHVHIYNDYTSLNSTGQELVIFSFTLSNATVSLEFEQGTNACMKTCTKLNVQSLKDKLYHAKF